MSGQGHMPFEYRPDFEEARRHWAAFWRGEIIDRPCARIVAPKDGMEPGPHPPGLRHPTDDLRAHVRAYDSWASRMYFAGDAIPFFLPNFGPDLFAAFVGADLMGFSAAENTSWAKPFIEDWKTDAVEMDRPQGYWWDAALDYCKLAAEIGEGKFGVAGFDLHSNLDCLAAARGPQRLCMDMIDCPDDVEAALDRVRRAFAPVYNGLYEAGQMQRTGTSSWLSFYCEGKYAPVQCDFMCMISPEHARRFVFPAIEEEAAFLDHCCLHYDGPDALVHLDDVLALKGVDAIQWVPGAGNAPLIEWMELLKKVQDSGKSLHICCTAEELKVFHRELRPEKVVYDVWASSQTEADGILSWLKSNT